MLVRNTDGFSLFFGESPLDVQRWLEATPRLWQYSSSTNSPHGGSWDLGASWEDTCKLARDGWHTGAVKLYDKLNAMPAPTTTHTKLRMDVAGHFPDVARYLQGDPAHMTTRGKVHGKKPTISIIVNATASASVNAQHYMNFGCVMSAVIDKLESHGRRVELSICFANAMNHTRALVGWRVKAAGEALDLANVAFSLAHPAAYRRFGFGLWERTAAHNATPGYGCCSDLTTEDAKHFDSEESLIVNATFGSISQCVGVPEAMAFVRKQINAAAGEDVVELDQ